MAKPSGIQLCKYTLTELKNQSEELLRLKDPHGYLRVLSEGTIEFLGSNPCARPDDLALILTIDGETVVGRLGLVAGRVRFRGKEDRLYWLSGFFLDRAYRQTGAGGLMLLVAVSLSQHLLASGGPARETQRLYKAAGFLELGPLRRFVAFRSARVLIEKAIGEGPLRSRLAAMTTPSLRACYTLFAAYGRMGAPRPKLTFEPVDFLPAELDRLLAAVAENCFPKTVRDLNWVLVHRHLLHPFVVWREGEIVGYTLMKVENKSRTGRPHNLPAMRLASLWDYYIAQAGSADWVALVEHARTFAAETHADVLEFQVSDVEIAALLRRFGFIHLGGNRIFYRPARPHVGCRAQDWHISHGIADVILV